MAYNNKQYRIKTGGKRGQTLHFKALSAEMYLDKDTGIIEIWLANDTEITNHDTKFIIKAGSSTELQELNTQTDFYETIASYDAMYEEAHPEEFDDFVDVPMERVGRWGRP